MFYSIQSKNLPLLEGTDVHTLELSDVYHRRFLMPTMTEKLKAGRDGDIASLYVHTLEQAQQYLLSVCDTYPQIAIACYCEVLVGSYRELAIKWLVEQTGRPYIGEVTSKGILKGDNHVR